MRKKYITIDDLDKEVSKSYYLIDDLKKDIAMYERDIKKEEQKVIYLNAVIEYLENNGLCPFTKKQILKDDVSLQDYAMPLVVKQDIIKIQCDIENNIVRDKNKCKVYQVSVSNLGQILVDFVNFVCEQKGYKIGVGDYLIGKFLNENKFC